METRNLIRIFSWLLVMPIAYLVLNIGMSFGVKGERSNKLEKALSSCEDKTASLDAHSRSSTCLSILNAPSEWKVKEELKSTVNNILLAHKQEELVREVIYKLVAKSRVYNILLYDKFIADLCNENVNSIEEELSQKVSTYSFEVVEESDNTLLVTATSNQDLLKNYSGGMIYDSSNYRVNSVLCEFPNTNTNLPQKPIVVNKDLKCPGDSKLITDRGFPTEWIRNDLNRVNSRIYKKVKKRQNSDFEQCYDL